MKTYKLIANPAAGGGWSREAILRVVDAFKTRGAAFDLELTTGPNQASEIVRRSLARFDAVVAVGGDGTVNEVLPGMVGTGKPLGIIPTGSGNDLVKSLDIPKNVEKAVDTVLEGRTRVIDVGRINGRYFANGVGIGFDAAVNREAYTTGRSRRGFWLYLYALVRLLGRFQPVPVAITMNGETAMQEILLLTVGNGTTVGGGFMLTPRARVDDGLLDVTIVGPLSVPTLLWHLPKVFFGTIERAKRYVRLERATRLVVESSSPLPVHVDGEIFEADGGRLEIECVPGALSVICGATS